MTRCFIAFGGNQGDVPATLRGAAEMLARESTSGDLKQSRLYRTTPVGSAAGGAYHNALAALDTDLSPGDLLTLLQKIEQEFGRTRQAHWGPRTLDLDLLACGDVVQSSPRLTLPHPHAWYRRFVLDPWRDVAADFMHPVLRETVSQLRGRLLARPLAVSVLNLPLSVTAALESTEGIVLVDADQQPAMTFARHADASRRIVGLGSVKNPADFARQILRAALDEPEVAAEADWKSGACSER